MALEDACTFFHRRRLHICVAGVTRMICCIQKIQGILEFSEVFCIFYTFIWKYIWYLHLFFRRDGWIDSNTPHKPLKLAIYISFRPQQI